MKPFKCPSCGHETALDLVSTIPDEQRMQFSITPGESGMLSADTVGSTLAQMQKLLQAMARQHDTKMNVSVCGLAYEDGKVTFDLLLTAIKPAGKKR